MARPQIPRKEQRSRREDAAILLPFFGFVLLMPPVLNLFGIRGLFFGAPPMLVYLFSAWLALIVGAVLLSRAAPFRAEVKPLEPLSDRLDAGD